MPERYNGIKFELRMTSRKLPENDCDLKSLIKWCRIFNEKGLAPPNEIGSCGNLSFRSPHNPGEFIITSSGCRLGEACGPEDFVTVRVTKDSDIVSAKGTKNPSSEAVLHKELYARLPDVNAVFHGHCAEISRHASDLGIATTRKEAPYGTIELAESVLSVIGSNNFIEMKNHGFISIGKTMDGSGKRAMRLVRRARSMKA